MVRMEESTQKLGQTRNVTTLLLAGVSPFNRLEPMIITTLTLAPPLKLLCTTPQSIQVVFSNAQPVVKPS